MLVYILARSSVDICHMKLSTQCHTLWDVGGEITPETGKRAVKGRTAIEQMDLLFVKIFPCVFCVLGWCRLQYFIRIATAFALWS